MTRRTLRRGVWGAPDPSPHPHQRSTREPRTSTYMGHPPPDGYSRTPGTRRTTRGRPDVPTPTRRREGDGPGREGRGSRSDGPVEGGSVCPRSAFDGWSWVSVSRPRRGPHLAHSPTTPLHRRTAPSAPVGLRLPTSLVVTAPVPVAACETPEGVGGGKGPGEETVTGRDTPRFRRVRPWNRVLIPLECLQNLHRGGQGGDRGATRG